MQALSRSVFASCRAPAGGQCFAGTTGAGRAFASQAVLRRVAARRAPGSASVPVRSMFVQTEETPNPDSLKFMPGQEVLEARFGTGMHFASLSDAQHSPLAQQLLRLDGVEGVFLANEFLTVTKHSEMAWEDVKPDVFASLMDFFTSGQPIVKEHDQAASDTEVLDDDDEVVALVKELIETRVRPTVQMDGGDIFYRGFDEASGAVYLEMAGSCSGCPSSSATLKQGVERMLMHYIPEVKAVEQVTNEELEKVNREEFEEFERKLIQAARKGERAEEYTE